MKVNQWTLGLAAAGVVSLGSVLQAEEGSKQVLTSLSSTALSGYVNTSAIWNLGTGRTVVGRAFDGTSKQDGFNLDVVNVTLEKPLSEDQWAAGYKVELLFGADAQNLGTSVGTDSFGDTESEFAAIKQAYVALRVPVGNGLDLKVGVWDTIIGYEVFNAGSNPNYSRSYGYQLEPTTHTGVLGSYRISDIISLTAGVANTYGPVINGKNSVESRKSYMGAIAITCPEDAGWAKGSTFYLGAIDSVGAGTPGVGDTVNVYAGGTLATPVEGLSLGAAFDYRFGGGQLTSPGNSNPWAYAVAAYVSFQATEKLKLNGRLDFTEGTDGTYFDAGRSAFPTSKTVSAAQRPRSTTRSGQT